MLWWRRSGGLPGDGDNPPVAEFPELLAADSRAARAAVAARISAFTPDWSPGSAEADPGVALVKVFGEQMAQVAQRANQLPEKYAHEQLRIAGVGGRGSRVGTVLVTVALVETAPDTVPVPEGTQLTAPGAGGAGQVVFETVRDLYVTPARLGMLVTQEGTRAAVAELTPQTPVSPLGRQPQPGNALWLGFAGPVPFPQLALSFELAGADAIPPPVLAGGIAGPPPSGAPTLSWELLTAEGLVPAELHSDGTQALRSSGIVEIGTVRDWPALPHPGLLDTPPESSLRWLRVGLLFGRYDLPPRVLVIRPNAVMAEGAETIRDEVLEPMERLGSSPTRQFRLSRAPVLPGTVRLVVDAPDPADLFDVASPRPAGAQSAWVEVPTLARSRPYDQHFVVDEATGVVTFGDGVRGAAVPAGFRHVLASRYRTGGGRASAVPAAAGFVPRQTIPFLAQIDNPASAAGAADAEPVSDLLARGPSLIRSRERAVTRGDLETLVLAASGDIGRAVALGGVDIDGAQRPGQVTVIVVGSRRGDGSSPAVTEETLNALARFLVDGLEPVVPLGTRLLVRAARFVPVQLEVALRPDDDADRPAVVLAVTRAVDDYLDPLTGGEDQRGWSIGEAVTYRKLASVVAGVAGVASVGRINISVGGRPAGPCRDAPLPAYTFPWPGHHLILLAGDLPGQRR